ncbi:Glycosylphosphatidylinositol:protein transamidase, GAA1 component [Dothidotthia symphoricarpi CBS 119687]|uniref:Glycosylphosphatidylinositol:protein transamidase, GAA1 component n=1 Tax=Dothidotthia symphoricarpi CBS 119687 TaxID=1392245 RepID=A0A6A6AGH1_9PLEO|nr:Glycosylphosphatidylinositol:protein transamidase, GAA1 component [Dothidotthia symphoricarpi CBS 119687]KAF2130148.1 Glycosylphosphatidylinositol:protein transamidase, GAA1 component [Dothidotthia symphoricarpi CBS 119687]
MALISSILALRRDARIQKIPPYLSAFCIIVGIAWLLVLPLNEYSRKTYVSENALLPGQVHTYFTGSEHNVFRAYRHEVDALSGTSVEERTRRLAEIFRSQNLKVATQKYNYHVSNRTIANENVYAILQGPRADATEAIVLIGAWKNMADEVNTSGVALVLTLARYFKRWSLWSKDIIFLVSGDSTSGPQAWVDAYHDGHDERYVESLKIKSGALQGAVAVDYPAGPWGHRYDKLHVVYDGVNGQLPNLDLFNTAVQVAGGQMGVGAVIQRMWKHTDTYQERLTTMLRGMVSQGMGHATGPHSSFIPYHVDAITLVTVGDGWHDEMTLGRIIESLFRSLNNLLEHLHQSFFFYLLLQANRFVSIGTYLPSAMLIAVSFSITSIALWVKSGRPSEPTANFASTNPESKAASHPIPSPSTSESVEDDSTPAKPSESEEPPTAEETQKPADPPVLIHTPSGSLSLLPAPSLKITERHLLFPLLSVLLSHLLGLLPLYLFNTWPAPSLPPLYLTAANLTTLLPLAIAYFLVLEAPPTPQQTTLVQCFSLLLLGMCLAGLATLNFSLSFLVGVCTAPLNFVHKARSKGGNVAQLAGLMLVNPLVVVQVGTQLLGGRMEEVLVKAAEGWVVWGLWTQVVVWVVWFPAWVCGAVVVAVGVLE